MYDRASRGGVAYLGLAGEIIATNDREPHPHATARSA
jgi:hypothetical protein